MIAGAVGRVTVVKAFHAAPGTVLIRALPKISCLKS